MSTATELFVRSAVIQMRAWLGKDALRSTAGRMLDEYQLKSELDEDLIKRVLAHFHADAMPVEGADYLAELETPAAEPIPAGAVTS